MHKTKSIINQLYKSKNFISNTLILNTHNRYLQTNTATNPAVTPTTESTTKQTSIQTKPTVVKPLESDDFFNLKPTVDLKQLFDSRAHYGHHIGLRNPWMNQYIFGTRMDIDIINLEKTVVHLQDALNVLAHMAFRNGMILFITKHPQHIPLVERLARETGEYAHCRKWMMGSFTDSLNRYGTVIRLPDLCVFLNTNDAFNEQHPAVVESAKMLIPTIGIVDTNTDPNLVTYPIPANDDTYESVKLYCNLMKEAVLRGKQKRKEFEQSGVEIL